MPLCFSWHPVVPTTAASDLCITVCNATGLSTPDQAQAAIYASKLQGGQVHTLQDHARILHSCTAPYEYRVACSPHIDVCEVVDELDEVWHHGV